MSWLNVSSCAVWFVHQTYRLATGAAITSTQPAYTQGPVLISNISGLMHLIEKTKLLIKTVQYCNGQLDTSALLALCASLS